jgi:putative hydrolase of the HAD superfamily
MFQLKPYFSGWYISGDIGLRKPDPQIYIHMLGDLRVEPGQVVFVDDRLKNLDPAAELGIRTVQYGTGGSDAQVKHRTIQRLTALLED